MKKLLALLLAMIVVLSFAACGDNASSNDDDDDDDDEKTTQTEKAEGTGEETGTKAPETTTPAAPETNAPVTGAPETQAPVTDAPVDTPTPTGFDKGSVANGVYTNNWLGFQYTIPAGLSDLTAMAGGDLDGVNEACGLCAVNMQTGSMIQILFEKKGFDPEAPATAKEGVEQLVAETKAETVDGVTITVSDVLELEIAGKTYWGADISAVSAEGSTYQSVIIGEYDGYFVIISLQAADDATLNTLIDGIAA